MKGTFVKAATMILCAGFCLALIPDAQAAKKSKAAKKTPTPVAEAAKDDAKATPNETPAATATANPTPAPKAEEAKTGRDVVAFTPKNPVVAGGLAVFPGVLVHGSGHFYAGYHLKGLGLLALEGVSGWLIYRNGNDVYNDVKTLMDSKDDTHHFFPTDVSELTTRVGIVSVATFLWFFTWLDDISGAPIATIKWNEKHEMEAREAALRLLPTQDMQGMMLSLKTNF